MPARGGQGPGRVGRGEEEGEDHGGGVRGDVVRGRGAEPDEGEEQQPERDGDDACGGGRAKWRDRHLGKRVFWRSSRNAMGDLALWEEEGDDDDDDGEEWSSLSRQRGRAQRRVICVGPTWFGQKFSSF